MSSSLAYPLRSRHLPRRLQADCGCDLISPPLRPASCSEPSITSLSLQRLLNNASSIPRRLYPTTRRFILSLGGCVQQCVVSCSVSRRLLSRTTCTLVLSFALSPAPRRLFPRLAISKMSSVQQCVAPYPVLRNFTISHPCLSLVSRSPCPRSLASLTSHVARWRTMVPS